MIIGNELQSPNSSFCQELYAYGMGMSEGDGLENTSCETLSTAVKINSGRKSKSK